MTVLRKMPGGLIGFCWALCATQAIATPQQEETPVPAAPRQIEPVVPDRPYIPPAPIPDRDQPIDHVGDLELAIRTFTNFLLYPNPAFRGAAGLHDDFMVTMLKRDGTPVRMQGDVAKQFLAQVFHPDNATFRFAAPEVQVVGRYGLVTRRFSVQEKDRRPECLTLHAEAFKTTRGWRFFSITIASSSWLEPCTLEAE
jgi:hypothetical protein